MKQPTIERILELNMGLSESKNLMETLSIDIVALAQHVVPNLQITLSSPDLKITKKLHAVACAIYQQYGFSMFHTLAAHRSDIIRSLACYLLGIHNICLKEKLQYVQPLADDSNSGVREWAWIAIRNDIAENILDAITILLPWTQHSSENIRRFASESTRPRGVWCQHIRFLRNAPWHALPLLDSLYQDPSRYVQLSVGNWLNDAGKDHPNWVLDLCHKWQTSSSTSHHTDKICRRALRTIVKKKLNEERI